MKNKKGINWFLKPKLSKKRVDEFHILIEELVEEKYKMRSIPSDGFYKWTKDKIEELYKFGHETASLSLQMKYAEEIKCLEKTLEIYEQHIKKRGMENKQTIDYTKLFNILNNECPHTLPFITEDTELVDIYASESEEDILSQIKKFYKVDIKSSSDYDDAETVKDLMNILNEIINSKDK